MKLFEANKKLKNKIARISIPNCPLSMVQAGDGWIKVQFRGRTDKTFLLKPVDPAFESYKKQIADFILPNDDSKKIRELAARPRRVSIVKRPVEDENAICSKVSKEIINISEQVGQALKNGVKDIIDTYGLNCDFSVLYRQQVPSAAETVDIDGRLYYYLNIYDPVRGAELWAPAMNPPIFASKMLKSANSKLNEDESRMLSLDEAYCPFPEFEQD